RVTGTMFVSSGKNTPSTPRVTSHPEISPTKDGHLPSCCHSEVITTVCEPSICPSRKRGKDFAESHNRFGTGRIGEGRTYQHCFSRGARAMWAAARDRRKQVDSELAGNSGGKSTCLGRRPLHTLSLIGRVKMVHLRALKY